MHRIMGRLAKPNKLKNDEKLDQGKRSDQRDFSTIMVVIAMLGMLITTIVITVVAVIEVLLK